MPRNLAKKLPRYPDVPVARVGRLAVDLNFRGRKLGAVLLSDAIGRATRSEVMVYGVLVDAKDDEAVAFYEYFGFVMLNAETRQLVWPIQRRAKK
jgi:predicted GNAT family N-acyltransferase